jgi:hypothetical protein
MTTIFLNSMVYSYTLCPYLLLEVMLVDPLVLYIPNKVELGLNEGFEILPLSYWWITL